MIINSLYLISLTATVISFALFWLLGRVYSFKQTIASLEDQLKNKLTEVGDLNNEKIELVKQAEGYKSKVNYLEQLTKDYERLKVESMQLAKSALFDLGKDLSKQLIELHKQENEQSKKSSEENIAKATEKLNQEFEKIVQSVAVLSHEVHQSKSAVDVVKQALLNPSGAGALAEITLENILKNSNLREGTDFMMQYHVSLKEGNYRPDAVVFLPGNNLMIIDAKASKFLLEIAAASEHEKAFYAEGFVKTMNNHLKQLSLKDYRESIEQHFTAKSLKVNHIVTLMFLPSEHAVEQITSLDKNFIEKAWDMNVFPVGPSGLINMLSFAKFQITDQMRQDNYKLILEEVKKILSSISTLAEYSKKFGSNLQSMVSSYDKFAGSFNRNFLSKAKHLQKLGIEPSGNKNVAAALERFQLVSSAIETLELEAEEVSVDERGLEPKLEIEDKVA
ncbi:MAG: rmuC [Rickettsiaceae bacterium]|jgi:DNA recombination protein RmuC|nr:rmuC [Rickettsiaceae bacterium]